MKLDDKTLDLAERFQDDCNAHAKIAVKLNSNISNQDATNVWIFNKLAELQIENYQLKDAIEFFDRRI